MTDLVFETVPWGIVENQEDRTKITAAFSYFDYPLDGLVYKYDNIEYYKSLGSTAHHPLGAMAFKFQDETAETTLIDIEWSLGRTGQITPIAVFEPVELEGSIVQRCSLANLSVMNEKLGKPYVGQKIWVTKRNMIIPYIERAEKISE